jgi:mannitol/fructose-specific phosphotransferase system IIA component (Ntr-type)
MSPSVETFLSYFDGSRFVPALRSTTKSSALREMVDLLAQDPEIRHVEILHDALVAREKLGSTGIGKGVAIPHGRSLSVPRIKALLARSKKGVEWESLDGAPVKILFMVVAPPLEKTNDYLPLLGALVGAMREKKNRDRVANAKSYADAMAALEDALRG